MTIAAGSIWPRQGHLRGAVPPRRKGSEPLEPRRDMARPYHSAHRAEPIPAGSANRPEGPGKAEPAPGNPARHCLRAFPSGQAAHRMHLRFNENQWNRAQSSFRKCQTLYDVKFNLCGE